MVDIETDPLIRGPLTKAEARRERLIATARILFAEHGFHGTGIAQIAKRSGIAVGQMYRDFANKEEIVAAIVERDLREYLDDAALLRAMETRDEHATRQWIAHFVAGEGDTTEGRLVAEIVAEAARNERVATIFNTVQQRLRGALTAALEVLAPEPAKEQRRELLAEVILTLSAGVFYRRLAQNLPTDPVLIAVLTRAVDREIDMLIAG